MKKTMGLASLVVLGSAAGAASGAPFSGMLGGSSFSDSRYDYTGDVTQYIIDQCRAASAAGVSGVPVSAASSLSSPSFGFVGGGTGRAEMNMLDSQQVVGPMARPFKKQYLLRSRVCQQSEPGHRVRSPGAGQQLGQRPRLHSEGR